MEQHWNVERIARRKRKIPAEHGNRCRRSHGIIVTLHCVDGAVLHGAEQFTGGNQLVTMKKLNDHLPVSGLVEGVDRGLDDVRDVAAGTTISYGGLAARIGRRGAARAVGSANRLNPIALVIPCHRVIGSTGALTGYAGGVERKRWLLRHEGALDEAAFL